MKLVQVIVLLTANQITEFITQTFQEMFIANEVLHLTTSERSIQQLQSTLCNTAHNTIITLDVIALFRHYTVSQKMHQLWNSIAQNNYNDRFWWHGRKPVWLILVVRPHWRWWRRQNVIVDFVAIDVAVDFLSQAGSGDKKSMATSCRHRCQCGRDLSITDYRMGLVEA